MVNKNFNTNTKNNGEWLTPRRLIQSLGTFDLDPCSPIVRPWDTADLHYNEIDDGLSKDWVGRVWLNPPYGKETFKWLEKLADHGDGIALIFARTETIGFHEQIWRKAHAVFFLKGRIKFCYVDGTQGDVANAPSCLVSYTPENTLAIKKSGLVGQLVIMNKELTCL